MLIIGISGRAGSGKSVVADHLIAEHGFRRVKFAGPLKAMVRALLATRGADAEIIERMIEGDLKEVPSAWLNGRTPRHAMITLGTEWGRDLMARDLWVDAAGDMLAAIRVNDPDARIVVDDVRFPNELDAIRGRGGVVWRIVREITAEDQPAAHPSEALVLPDDVLRIYNTRSIGELRAYASISLAAIDHVRARAKAAEGARA